MRDCDDKNVVGVTLENHPVWKLANQTHSSFVVVNEPRFWMLADFCFNLLDQAVKSLTESGLTRFAIARRVSKFFERVGVIFHRHHDGIRRRTSA